MRDIVVKVNADEEAFSRRYAVPSATESYVILYSHLDKRARHHAGRHMEPQPVLKNVYDANIRILT
jgi:hypothetical protein